MEKRPTDLKALFLLKVFSNDDAFYPLVVFLIRWAIFLNIKLSRLRDSSFQLV